MRKLILMVGLIVVGIACGDAVGEMLDSGVPDAGAETPGDGSSMQYVGNSTETFSGDSRACVDLGGGSYDCPNDNAGAAITRGIFPEYAACQETFGPGHRTCTSQEIEFTTKIPQLEGNAWFGIGGGCSVTTGRRLAVTPTGAFVSEYCNISNSGAVERPIACCGPK